MEAHLQFPSFPSPAPDDLPLDFSSKRPRLSTPSPPASPISTSSQLTSTPILSVPCPPRTLQPSLPDSPQLPFLPQGQPRFPLSPVMMSPFLFGPAAALSLPNLLQSMARAQAAHQQQQQQQQQQANSRLLSPQQQQEPSAQEKAELIKVNSDSLGHYAAFRQNMLQQLAQKKSISRRNSSDSGGDGTSSSDNTMGSLLLQSPTDSKDHQYWERRRKNNLAAKRSRDARRAKEDEIAIRAAFLEQENVQLKWEVTRLKSETGRLRAVLMAEDDTDCDLVQNQP